MKLGVCVTPWWPHGWAPPIPSLAAWKALVALGITDVRLTTNLSLLFPDQGTENWPLLDQFIQPMISAGLLIYNNPGGCPPWASEGQPAYIGSIAGWPPETPVPPAAWAGTSWWDDPDHGDPNHIHYFGDPKFAAVDAKMPPRPYLVTPPHRSPAFYEDAGYRLTMQYAGMIDSSGVDNEPGGAERPEMRMLDKAYNANGGDMIRDRFFPEIVVPFTNGVRRAQPRMTLVGPEADGDGVLDRICELDNALYRARPLLNCYDILSVHPYGDLIGGDYRTMKAFDAVLAKWKSRRPVRIGEIGGDPQALYDWTVATTKTHPDLEGIFYGDASYFFQPGSWPTDPVLSAIGEKLKALFITLNGLGE